MSVQELYYLWSVCMYVCMYADLKSSKSEGEEVEGGHVIPLLLQNKPPVGDDGEAGELADLSMRPDPVS